MHTELLARLRLLIDEHRRRIEDMAMQGFRGTIRVSHRERLEEVDVIVEALLASA